LVLPAIDRDGKCKVYKPEKSSDTMVKEIENSAKRDNFFVFVDNPPKWNPRTRGYHYDFKGRVSEASVKNF
jgi:hypothetical protein